MKLSLSILAVSGLSATWMCMPAPSRSATPDAPSAPEPVAQQGQQRMSVTQFYNNTCAPCHGQNGQGGGGGTRSFLTDEKMDQKYDKVYFDAIKNGVEDMGMEAYGGTMSDAEIWAQVVHIRELQHEAWRARKGSSKAENGVYTTQKAKYKVETVVTGPGLSTPWAVDWLPDGRMLLTNRNGVMYLVKDGQLGEPIEGVPASVEMGQGGLMDVAVHPNYKANGWVYLSLADPAASGNGAFTKIVRGKLSFSGNTVKWTGTQTIYQAKQEFYVRAGVHFGSRISFDGKGHIYFTIGERGTMMKVQDWNTPYGKVFRVNEDGTIPADNPHANGGGDPAVWSTGHRNQQGLTIDLEGNVWATEHGPRGGDELNLIKKGANYGWPVAALSINYNDSPLATPWPSNGLKVEQPVFRWIRSIGASGFDTMRGNKFPEWSGDLFAGGLSGANVDRFKVKGGKMIEREEILHGMGRVRDVVCGPDGYLYIVLNGPDRVIRLVPAK